MVADLTVHHTSNRYKEQTRMPETRLTSKMVGNTLKTSADSTKLIPL